MSKMMSKKAKSLSFYDHLDELRERLIKSLLVIVFFSCLAFQIKDQILSFIIKPIGSLVFISPADAFVVYVTLSLFVGLLASFPVLLYQGWRFIAGALREEERRFVYSFGPFSLLLFVFGTLFAYYLVIPISLNFLLSFSNESLMPMISVKSYISFVATLILAFGIIFEFPLVILFLAKIGIATPAFLIQKRKYAVVLIFIVSALVTPPDLITQWLMALPLILLYELSIFGAKLIYKQEMVYEQ